MRERRHILGISQAKLAEKANTSPHYIGMIEKERKFPAPEMLERIAKALEFDTPALFSTRNYPSDNTENMIKCQELMISDISQVIEFRLKEFEQNK